MTETVSWLWMPEEVPLILQVIKYKIQSYFSNSERQEGHAEELPLTGSFGNILILAFPVLLRFRTLRIVNCVRFRVFVIFFIPGKIQRNFLNQKIRTLFPSAFPILSIALFPRKSSMPRLWRIFLIFMMKILLLSRFLLMLWLLSLMNPSMKRFNMLKKPLMKLYRFPA